MTSTFPFKAVLWDMDGVLVDTFEGHYHAWSRLFSELGHPFTREDFRGTFGMNNRNIFKALLDYELSQEEFQVLSDRKEQYFRANVKGNTELLAGVADWLQQFRNIGIMQAVASSAPQENIDVHLDELKIGDYFKAVVSGEHLPGKPDPAVFLMAAQRLGVDPVDCLVFEDAVQGVQAAKRASMCCVAVLTTNPAEKLQQADLIVHDLTHLTLEMLKRINHG